MLTSKSAGAFFDVAFLVGLTQRIVYQRAEGLPSPQLTEQVS